MPEKLPLCGLYVHYVVHICDFGMLRVKKDINFMKAVLLSRFVGIILQSSKDTVTD